MRVIVTGATGLVGSALCAKLRIEGHDVNPVSRHVPRACPAAVLRDMAFATSADDWTPHLRGIDAVVNCAGVLQDSPGEDTRRVHHAGVVALFRACEQAGIRRVIHFSAIGRK